MKRKIGKAVSRKAMAFKKTMASAMKNTAANSDEKYKKWKDHAEPDILKDSGMKEKFHTKMGDHHAKMAEKHVKLASKHDALSGKHYDEAEYIRQK